MQTLKNTTFLMRPTDPTSAEGGTQSAHSLAGGRIRKASGEPEETHAEPGEDRCAFGHEGETVVELTDSEGRRMHAWLSIYNLVRDEYERMVSHGNHR